jgi:hypothetical protein
MLTNVSLYWLTGTAGSSARYYKEGTDRAWGEPEPPSPSETVTLTDEVDVSRGDMLVRPDRPPHVSSQIEAMVVWMAEQPFVPGRTYTLKHTTRQVSAEVAAFRERLAAAGIEASVVAEVLELADEAAGDAARVQAVLRGQHVTDLLLAVTAPDARVLGRGGPTSPGFLPGPAGPPSACCCPPSPARSSAGRCSSTTAPTCAPGTAAAGGGAACWGRSRPASGWTTRSCSGWPGPPWTPT